MRILFPTLVVFLALRFSPGATLTVTNTNDSGAGSLRQAIADASPGDTIQFDLPTSTSVIGLTSGELLIDKSLTITGPGAASLRIEGAGSNSLVRVFNITAGELNVTLTALTVAQGGFAKGSGLLNDSSGTVNIQQCVFRDNFGIAGGGIANEGTLNLTACTITDNSVSFVEGGGGGIYNNGVMTITGCTISDNQASDSGGGPPNVLGAGIVNYGVLTMSNDTVSDNVADGGHGGGVANASGSLTIASCTIASNVATSDFLGPSGGGLFISAESPAADVHLKNSIVAQNEANTLSNGSDIGGAFSSDGYNLIGSNAGASFTPGTADQVGTPTFPIDPVLGPLQDNGGPTLTRALLFGSPAVDKGKSSGLTTDQRGRYRRVDGPAIPPSTGGDNSDIGAYEVQAAQALNISTRAKVLTGEEILDAGFIITGLEAKEVIIRGLGPSLGSDGLTGVLTDPLVRLYDQSGALVQSNDNWKDTQEAAITATGIPPTKDAESAIVTTLEPGSYTAVLSGKSGDTGIGLVEVYDLDAAAISTLANVSTRGFVGTLDDVMIGGFILGAGGRLRDQVLVRALGPSLQASGISDPLQDPALELHDAEGTLVASNENWQDTQASEIEATSLAPSDPDEAAILQTAVAGSYTAIVRGTNATTGVALLEVYDLH